MKVRDLIISPVTTCSISTKVGEVRDLMLIKKFSALPVVEIKDNNVLLRGIVSYQDLVGVYSDDINVQQVMTSNATTISIDADIQEAALLMTSKRIHHLVGLDQGEIAGIISSFDFVKFVADSNN